MRVKHFKPQPGTQAVPELRVSLQDGLVLLPTRAGDFDEKGHVRPGACVWGGVGLVSGLGFRLQAVASNRRVWKVKALRLANSGGSGFGFG